MLILDTNAVIYLQNGQLKEALPPDIYGISIITEIELFSFPGLSEGQEIWLNKFIKEMHIFPLDEKVKYQTILLRKKYKIKIPDAIILATAIGNNITLLTNDQQLLNISVLKARTLELK